MHFGCIVNEKRIIDAQTETEQTSFHHGTTYSFLVAREVHGELVSGLEDTVDSRGSGTSGPGDAERPGGGRKGQLQVRCR